MKHFKVDELKEKERMLFFLKGLSLKGITWPEFVAKVEKASKEIVNNTQ